MIAVAMWSAVGQKRKWRRFQVMSALHHKADIDDRDCDSPLRARSRLMHRSKRRAQL